MEASDNPEKTGKVRSGKMASLRPCLAVIVILIICCLALVGVIIWLLYEQDVQEEKSILEKYPGLFMTEKENAEVRYAGTLLPEPSFNSEVSQCPPNSSRGITEASCCITRKGFIRPTELPSADPRKDRMVEVVQLPIIGQFQFFSVEECCRLANCTNCTCTQRYRVATALVQKPNDTQGFEPVLVPGSCDCPKKGLCPEGWAAFRDSCYMLFTETESWSDAQETCQTHGANLPVVLDLQQSQAIGSLLPPLDWYPSKQAWIGLSDQVTEGRYLWLNTSQEAKWFNWDAGEPNDEYGRERCVAIIPDGRWNDAPCNYPLKFVCEKPA